MKTLLICWIIFQGPEKDRKMMSLSSNTGTINLICLLDLFYLYTYIYMCWYYYMELYIQKGCWIKQRGISVILYSKTVYTYIGLPRSNRLKRVYTWGIWTITARAFAFQLNGTFHMMWTIVEDGLNYVVSIIIRFKLQNTLIMFKFQKFLIFWIKIVENRSCII